MSNCADKATYAATQGGTEIEIPLSEGSGVVECTGEIWLKSLRPAKDEGTVTLTAQWEIALPPEYEKLDCLDNGINRENAGFVQVTGFKLGVANAVAITYCINDTSYQWQNLFFSHHIESDGKRTEFGLCYPNVSGTELMSYHHGFNDAASSITNADVSDKNVTNTLVLAETGSTFNGSPILFGGTQPSSLAGRSLPNDLLIFCSDDKTRSDGYPYDDSGKPCGPAFVKIFSFQVMANGAGSEVILDLVPAKRKADDAEGFYDLINGGFYPLRHRCAGPTEIASHAVETWQEEPATESKCGYKCGVCTNCLMRISQMIPAIQGASEWRWDGEKHWPGIAVLNNDWWGVAGCVVTYNPPNKTWKNVRDDYTATFTLTNNCVWTDGSTTNIVYRYKCIDPEFSVIRPNGPKVVFDKKNWLNYVYDGDWEYDAYQKALFETNANGVVAWQAYVLGVGATKEAVEGAAIVEETVQNANPDTVTIRLRGMPENPRTNDTCRLAYSLLSARTPEGFANGGGTVVKDLEGNPFERCEKSTFEAPLKDLDDDYPVNYYRIKVHFIFGGGGDEPAVEVIYQVLGAVTSSTEGWTIGDEVYSPKIDISSADAKYIQLKFKATEPCKMSRSFLYFYKTQDQSSEDASLGDGIYSGEEQEYWHTYRVPNGANWIDLGFFNSSGHTGGAAPVTLADVEIAAVSEAQAVAGAKAVSAQFDRTLLDKVMADDLAPASDPAWGRGLPRMKAALKGGASQYKVLVLTCSTLVHVQWEGLLAEQVRDRFPGANIDIDFFTQSNNDTAGQLKAALDKGLFDVTAYDCIMIHTSFLYRGDESNYKSNLAALIDACKAKKSELEIVVVSPLFTVEPRNGYFEYYAANVESYYTAFDSSCAAADDYMTNGDWWKKVDWKSEAETNVKEVCAKKGVAYWGVYDAAYDYVWKSAKPIGWFNRSSYGFYINERGRQLNVEILLGAFQRLADCQN